MQKAKEGMNILLVNPPTPGFSYYSIGTSRPPLGLAYLAAMIKEPHTVRIIDFNVEKLDWRRFPYGEYDLVGISGDTLRYLNALRIASLAKGQGTTVVLGGHHVTFQDMEALETGVVDYVVRNEGEYSFKDLVQYLYGEIPLETVMGISYRQNGHLIRKPLVPTNENLDSLPLPARDLLHLNLYSSRIDGRLAATLITSRGCHFNCDFCSSSKFFGKKQRMRSIENVMEEVEIIFKKYKYRAIAFVDDHFTLNPDRVVTFSESLLKKGWDLRWGAWSRVDTIVKNPEMVRIMAKAGFVTTFIGFESGSQQTLDHHGKKAILSESFEAMDILKSNNVKVSGGFILGSLNETRAMIRKTIQYAKKLDPFDVQFSILTPYPGTKLFDKVKDRLLTHNWEKYTALNSVIRTDYISPRQLRRLLIEAYVSFYGRPKKFIENRSYIYPILLSFLRRH